MKEKQEGNFSLLLCWALIGRPRAITKVLILFKCIFNLTLFFRCYLGSAGKTAFRVHIALCVGEEKDSK